MKTIIARLLSDTPAFFKKVIAWALSLSAIGVIMVALPTDLSAAGISIHIPAVISTIGGYFIAIGLVAAKIAKLTVVDPNDLPK